MTLFARAVLSASMHCVKWKKNHQNVHPNERGRASEWVWEREKVTWRTKMSFPLAVVSIWPLIDTSSWRKLKRWRVKIFTLSPNGLVQWLACEVILFLLSALECLSFHSYESSHCSRQLVQACLPSSILQSVCVCVQCEGHLDTWKVRQITP